MNPSSVSRSMFSMPQAFHPRFPVRPTVVATLAALCSLGVAQGAYADDTPPDNKAEASAAKPASQKASTLNTVVITGTSIRGIAPVGASLNVMSKESISATGATTSTELMRSIPELGSFNSTGINTGSNQANFVDQPAIHGVGVGNGGGGLTLVLVDGHRLPGAGINQSAPDAGAIPTSALQRVEVMADGGSAVYGSDAIAGVINFVTRSNFDGAETGLRVGAADGYRTKNFSQLWGKTWDGGSALLDFEYSENTALNGRSRSYITNNQTSSGGTDTRSTNCSPANVTVGNQTFALSAAGLPALGVNKCDSNVANDLYPAQHRSQLFGKVRQEVGDNVTLYSSVLYSDRQMQTRVAGGGVTQGALSVAVPSTSPFYIQMPGTATGAAQSVTYDPANDFGATFTNTTGTKTLSAVVGAEIDLGANWNAQVELNHGMERDDIIERGLNQSLAQAAANAGTFNPYGVGAATNAGVLAGIGNYSTHYFARQTLDDFTLKADGPLFKLPGGAVRAALGYAHRKEQFAGETDAGPAGGDYTAAPYSSVGTRTSDSAFAELFVPVVGQATSLPGVQKLDLSLAIRSDRYSDVGSTNNPKIGLTWTVTNGAMLRASAGKSFHAPSLADAGTAIDTRAIHFPCIPYAFQGCTSAGPADYTVILAGGNSALKPETATTYNVGFDFTPAFFNSGFNASLSYFSIDYKNVITFPTFAPVTNPVSAYDKYRTLRPAGATDAEWLAVIQPLLAGFRHDGQVYPDIGQLPLAVYDLRRQNFADEFIRGFDYNLGYKFNTTVGRFNINLAGTHLTRFDQRIPGVADSIQLLDTNYAVKNKARTQLGWAQGDLAASFFVNYTDGYKNTGVTPVQQVASFLTVDSHLAWNLRDGMQLSLDVSNLLDKRPPVYYTAGNNGVIGYDPTVSSALGRMFTVGLHKTW
ncbi:TonB-dependent receptor plug domain-containing protein [Roseateles koreensis]|uniref:TonB-dependent receptor n=1 Tax=Roseateles koreensis TaxID=2987526 RepID=A0ABT5KQM4_9BURK|nr:TonB-dependent receptor [Roseateles koreensis]MDC8784673.1 TonB-dependent receptor [Roseateles koreensis]